jgi:hypothetical protein
LNAAGSLEPGIIKMAEIRYIFSKVIFILRETIYLVKKHRLYFLAPLFIMLAILSFFVYYFGPAVIVSFIYAGV